MTTNINVDLGNIQVVFYEDQTGEPIHSYSVGVFLQIPGEGDVVQVAEHGFWKVIKKFVFFVPGKDQAIGLFCERLEEGNDDFERIVRIALSAKKRQDQ